MSDIKLLTGRDFGKALCKHFALSVDQVHSDYRLNTLSGGMFSVSLTVGLTADDVARIARHAGSKAFAGGGYYPGGLRIVDEHGPEIIRRQNTDAAPGKQELKIMVDATEAVDKIKAVLRDGIDVRQDVYRQAAPGDALPTDPDPRLDEIVSLLQQLVALQEGIAGGNTIAVHALDEAKPHHVPAGPVSGHWHADRPQG